MYRVVEVGSFSYPQPSKAINEDFLLLPTYDQDLNIIFAVADGVGSYKGASNVSTCVIDAISKLSQEQDFTVESALLKAKKQVDELADTNENMLNSATTLTLVHISRHCVTIGHVGDSRAYVKRDNKLVQLTKDHTRYQELLDSKEHSVRKLAQHKQRLSSVITKAITKQSDLNFDLIEIPLEELLDRNVLNLVLMTDGAYNHWHKRARFSESTMSSPLAFSNSLRKRILKSPTDDFTCLNVKIEI